MAAASDSALVIKLMGMAILGGVLVWHYTRIAQGTGRLVLLLGLAANELGMYFYPPAFVPIALILIVVLVWFDRRQTGGRTPYQSVQAVFEGGGIKRGLTPPEAALLVGKPFQQSLALKLVGMLKKGFIQLAGVDPTVLGVDDKLKTRGRSLNAETRSEIRHQGAQALNQVVYPYEDRLLELLEQEDGKTIAEIDFEILVKPFLDEIAGRIEGFDLNASREYYKLIVARAPKEARLDGELVKEFAKVYEKNLGWILLDNNYDKILREPEHQYRPGWLPVGAISIGDWFRDVQEEIGEIDYSDSVSITLGKMIDPVAADLLSAVRRATPGK